EEVEGDYRDVIERKPTNAPTPFLCILDEYGYYAVKGFAVVPAQARSLGFSAIFAGQDLPAFQKASKEEAASIGANCNIKICMKLEDPTDTWDFFTKTAGEAYVTKVDSFQVKDASFSNSYMDTRSSSFEKRARIDLLDLKEQTEGEGHIFFKSKIVRAKMFYANPPPVKRIKVNQFLKVETPPDEFLAKLFAQLKHFYELIDTENYGYPHVETNDVLSRTRELMSKYPESSFIDKALKMLLEFEGIQEMQGTFETENIELSEGEICIFSELKWPGTYPSLMIKNVAEFSEPIINVGMFQSGMASIQNLSGEKMQTSQKLANDLVNELKLCTTYPNYPPLEISAADLAQMTKFIADKIKRVVESSK
ncbi:MAG: intracellular multiplication protein IcmO, partial [Pseudomonadota bacterium]|nr:intracellular multiplication protein IcmO [Pseudomonadota bacterium]